MSKQLIEFFWDPGSPYTYLAAARIEAIAADSGADLAWRPFLLGAVFKATGNRTPASIPAKGDYLREDLQAWADYYKVPLRFPEVFPGNSMLAVRVAVAMERDNLQVPYAKAVMRLHWEKGLDIASEAVIGNLIQQLGADSEAVLERAASAPIKQKLRTYTDEAISRGAFGAPTFFVGDKLFWGNDRLPLLHAHIMEQRGH